jgi:hypothetical protein
MHSDLIEAQKYIGIFTEGFVEVNDPFDFIKSSMGRYLAMVYGELIYTEEPCTNFLNVYKHLNKLVIAECVFYDRFPNLCLVGKIIPKRSFKKLKNNERGGSSEEAIFLANSGYLYYDFNLPDKCVTDAFSQNYEEMDHISLNFKHIFDASRRVCYKPKSDNDLDILETIREAGRNADLSDLSISHTNEFKKLLKNKMSSNHLFNDNSFTYTEIHRMRNTHRLDCHIDANATGESPFYITHVTWYFLDKFEGRELYSCIRSAEDFLRTFEKGLNWTLREGTAHPIEYKEIFRIKPILNKGVLVNTFNPLMCHGVSEMTGTGAVYSYICNVRPFCG